MTTQINLRFPDELLGTAKDYAQTHGYLNVQEFIRDAVREKIYDNLSVREDYLIKLESKEANTFLNDEEADELDRQLEKQANLE